MEYPETPEREKEVLLRYGLKIEGVDVPEDVMDGIVKLVRATREESWSRELDQGASVRAGLALYEKVQSLALLSGRDRVTMDDVRSMAASSLCSRIRPSPASKFYDDPTDLIKGIVSDVLGS